MDGEDGPTRKGYYRCNNRAGPHPLQAKEVGISVNTAEAHRAELMRQTKGTPGQLEVVLTLVAV